LATTKAAGILKDIEMDGGKFTPKQIEKFKSDPRYYLQFVKAIEEEVNSRFPSVCPIFYQNPISL